jgi:hypothetical protein
MPQSKRKRRDARSVSSDDDANDVSDSDRSTSDVSMTFCGRTPQKWRADEDDRLVRAVVRLCFFP